MSTAVFTVDIKQLDASDQRAIRFSCDQENKRRRDASVEERDFSTAALRKTYYESLFVEAIKELHKRNVSRAERDTDSQKEFQDLRSAWVEASPEQREAALKAMSTPVTG